MASVLAQLATSHPAQRAARKMPAPHVGYGLEQIVPDATWKPYKDAQLSHIFGREVDFYNRTPTLAERGYSTGPGGLVALSMPYYQQLSDLRLLASGKAQGRLAPTLNGHMARAAWALAHELGHAHLPHGGTEAGANAWAASQYGRVLKRLGVGAGMRKQLWLMARNQSLV